MNNALPLQRCTRCGQDWYMSHYCPSLNDPGRPRAVPTKALTEEDVRRIVREELKKAAP